MRTLYHENANLKLIKNLLRLTKAFLKIEGNAIFLKKI